MEPFDIHTLNSLYARISANGGVSVADLQLELAGLFQRRRSEEDLTLYRLKRPPWKKLGDEVVPALRFLRLRGIESGRVQFPLDSHPPDCWLWQDGANGPIGIEVTIAQATERYHLVTELVETGMGRGFIGISDDAPQADFNKALSKECEMFSTDQALAAIGAGIRRCLSRKNHPRFAGLILLIQAPLDSLPGERWTAIGDDLRTAAVGLPFREIFVISDSHGEPWGFHIKS